MYNCYNNSRFYGMQGCPSDEEVDAASGRLADVYSLLFEALAQLPTEHDSASFPFFASQFLCSCAGSSRMNHCTVGLPRPGTRPF